MSSRKRKNRSGRYPTDRAYTNNFLRSQHTHSQPTFGHDSIAHTHTSFSRVESELDPSLFIVAHEADVIRGPQAESAAMALEVRGVGKDAVAGDGLIKWDLMSTKVLDEEGQESEVNNAEAVWVDRYDARLLLTSPLTVVPSQNLSNTRAASPSGWSDLPSDSEDTFFFQPSEVEDYRNAKRRRLLEESRQARMRAIQEDGDVITTKPEDEWGGSDEEPPEPEKQIMQRTATHILSSPNPSQLEMRILANHGADPRFAFLKGRWKKAWAITKATVRKDMQEKEEREKREGEGKGKGLGGLMGYDDSDEESDGDEEKPEEATDKENNGENSSTITVDAESRVTEHIVKDGVTYDGEYTVDVEEEARKEARRARAKEWAEKRRLQKAGEGLSVQGENDGL